MTHESNSTTDDTTSGFHRVVVMVEPRYLPEHSRPEDSEYAFAYTVSITNEGKETVQLISRHWIITDGNNLKREVKGEGVVGQQPHIEPGETYQYSSGAIINTRAGTMEGSYQMLADDGSRFDANIDEFVLSTPRVLH